MTDQNTWTTANAGAAGTSSDAVERYRYLLRTAPPDQLEKAHEEAFAQMSESDRQEVLRALANAGADTTDTSASGLARSATRLEMLKPGSLDRTLSRTNLSTGTAALGGLAVGVLGSAVFNYLFDTGGRPGLLRRLFGGRMGMGGMGMGNMMGGGMGGFGTMMGGMGGGPRHHGGPGGFGGGPGGGFGGGPGGGGGFGGGPGGR